MYRYPGLASDYRNETLGCLAYTAQDAATQVQTFGKRLYDSLTICAINPATDDQTEQWERGSHLIQDGILEFQHAPPR